MSICKVHVDHLLDSTGHVRCSPAIGSSLRTEVSFAATREPPRTDDRTRTWWWPRAGTEFICDRLDRVLVPGGVGDDRIVGWMEPSVPPRKGADPLFVIGWTHAPWTASPSVAGRVLLLDPVHP